MRIQATTVVGFTFIRDGLLNGLLWVGVLFWPIIVQAHQPARVFAPVGHVYESPSKISALLVDLPEGTPIQIGLQNQRGWDGDYWYKIRLESGSFGYIAATEINTIDQFKALHDAGFQTSAIDDSNLDLDAWEYEARFMGMIGGEIITSTFETSMELELVYALPIYLKGNVKRIFAVGPSLFIFDNREPALLASLAITPLQEIRMQNMAWMRETTITPEIRLRIGKGIGTPLLLLGASVGITFPLSIHKKDYYSGYIELGTLEKYALGFYHFWFSVGASYRF